MVKLMRAPRGLGLARQNAAQEGHATRVEPYSGAIGRMAVGEGPLPRANAISASAALGTRPVCRPSAANTSRDAAWPRPTDPWVCHGDGNLLRTGGHSVHPSPLDQHRLGLVRQAPLSTLDLRDD